MVTKIKSTDSSRLSRITGQRVAKGKGGTASKSQGSNRRDDVAVSAASRTIGRADDAAHAAPDIRAAVVAPIREAIANGQYKVSSLDVADKILRQVLMERKRAV